MNKSSTINKLTKQFEKRMKWWHEARFGMFIHWGLYSQLGRHEWVMNRERIPVAEYDKLADTFRAKPRAARTWARLAKKAGMKYMVMTTKHHEGFCMWDTRQTDFNSVIRSPGRDLVAEYVQACHEFGLKVGFYYSLMDWRHPDGARCAKNKNARGRFLDFTQGCVRELMSNYGKIDILWYDVPWPLKTAKQWESRKMNSMVRRHQPHIIINNRSLLPEDYSTPEENIKAEKESRAWEACMTLNGAWGYMPSVPQEDWLSARDVLGMLCSVTGGGGNLLLNIGPESDGSVQNQASQILSAIGKWLDKNGDAVYGKVDRTDERFEWHPAGSWNSNNIPWTLKGRTAYFWITRWPGRTLVIGGLKSRLRKASFLASSKPVKFRQQPDRLILHGLPRTNPDKIAGVNVIKLEFASKPRQKLGFAVL